MSRTYEALQKVDRQRTAGGPAVLDEHPRADTTSGARARYRPYEPLQVWLGHRSSKEAGGSVIMVAGCRSGSGATTTVGGLAAALIEQPATRVVVVDANLRTPCLGILGDKNGNGLSELLTNMSATAQLLVQQTRRSNLFVLGTGTLSCSPPAIFERSAVQRLLAELRTRFDFILLDVPPLLEFPEGYALASQADAVLLVIHAEQTSVEDARRAVRDLERIGARPVGIVLNRQREYIPRFIRRLLGIRR